jgi:hypothetical protein
LVLDYIFAVKSLIDIMASFGSRAKLEVEALFILRYPFQLRTVISLIVANTDLIFFETVKI